MTKFKAIIMLLVISLGYIFLAGMQTASAAIVYHQEEGGQIIYNTETGTDTGYTGSPTDVNNS